MMTHLLFVILLSFPVQGFGIKIGECIEGYQVIEKLSRGNCSKNYLIEKDGEYYRLKQYHLPSNPPKLSYLYMDQEREFLLELNHPGIIKPIEKLGPYLILEYVEGKSLCSCTLSCRESLRSIRQILELFTYACKQQFVYTNLDAENFYFTSSGDVKIMDRAAFVAFDDDAGVLQKPP